MKKLVVANWKMNPQTAEEARKLISAWEHGLRSAGNATEVVVAAPFVFLPLLSKYVKTVKLGSQNISWVDQGAMTGEISGRQLREFGVTHVILGHSERRMYLGETDSMVNAKVLAALKNQITPILCLGGETGSIKNEMKTLVTKQFIHATKGITNTQLKKIIYVYEPSWAISTMKKSESATGAHAAELINHIQTLLEHRLGRKHARGIQILYGGSVNQTDAHEYAKYPEIGGALVGAASLHAENFWHVVEEFGRESIHSTETH